VPPEAAYTNQAWKQQLSIWEQMVTLQMRHGEAITQYISRASSIQEQLTRCGKEITDEDIQLPILNGLPKVPAYEMLRSSLRYAQKSKTLTLSELQPMLIAAERDHKVDHGGAAEHSRSASCAQQQRGQGQSWTPTNSRTAHSSKQQ